MSQAWRVEIYNILVVKAVFNYAAVLHSTPVVFNLFAEVSLVFHHGMSAEDDIPITYRLDSSWFNICRFEVEPKVTSDTIFVLQ